MARQRATSVTSTDSSTQAQDQELGSMYDYLCKVILLGPSGSGKSCILHRYVKNEWRVLTSQTIGVEFASKIVKVGTGARRKRVKLQLWDTAGTERFRSVSRSYYRGAAGALLVYDISSRASFASLPTFLNDARALASPYLTMILAGNKADLLDDDRQAPGLLDTPSLLPSSFESGKSTRPGTSKGSVSSSKGLGLGSQKTATVAIDGREVTLDEASQWASEQCIPVSVEVSALSGDNVEEVFSRLARMILTKIELGEIDPDDPQSGIQYGDSGGWPSTTSEGPAGDDVSLRARRRRPGRSRGSGLRDWEEVFRLDGRRRRNCC